MSFDAIHIATNGMVNAMRELEYNAQNIASTTLRQQNPNLSTDLPATSVVTQASAPANVSKHERGSGYWRHDLVSNVVQNLQLSHQVKVLSKTVKTADTMLGIVINTQHRVDVYV